MHLKIRYPVMVCLLLGAFLFPQQETKNHPRYRCPLKSHNGYSSSFQEFRASHFHGGIDFRTFQRTGLPIHAISDGAIYRIRMEKRGSGRGVYLRHVDGNASLYFHLERFSPVLEALLKKRQGKLGKKYVGNIELTPPLSVVAGQVIGFTGETGAGFPHLHLEIRDPEGNKLNPFLLVNTGCSDENPPLIESVVLRSRGVGLVNGRVGEVKIPMSRKNGVFQPEQVVVTTGGMDVVAGVRDISDTGRSVAPGMIRALLDGKPVYGLKFTRFSWEDNNQLGFIYDMRESRSSRFYFNLFSQKGNEFEQTGVSLRPLIDNMTEGLHELSIHLEDHFGNTANGRIPLIRRSLPRIRMGSVIRRGKKLSIEVVECRIPGVDRVEASLMNRSGKRISSRSLTGRIEAPGILELQEPGPATVVELRFFTRGIPFAAYRYSVASGQRPVLRRIQVVPYLDGDTAVLRIQDFPLGADALRMRLAAGGKTWEYPFTSIDGLYFRLLGREIPADTPGHRIPLQFGVMEKDRLSLLLQETVSLIRLIPGKSETLQSGKFFARFGPRTVREPRLMSLSTTHHPVPFPQLSEQVSIVPDHFAFLDRVDYGFRVRVKQPRQAAIFMWNHHKQKWKCVSTRFNPGKSEFTSRVRVSGTYTLLRDTSPPSIGFRRLGPSQLPLITISDQGTGVDDESVKVLLDGVVIESEYDPDRRWLVFESLPEIFPGTHNLEVRCLDRARNRRVRSVRWKIAPGKRGKKG